MVSRMYCRSGNDHVAYHNNGFVPGIEISFGQREKTDQFDMTVLKACRSWARAS